MVPCPLRVDDVHEFYEGFAYCWAGVSAFWVRSWNCYFFDWAVFLALCFQVVFEVLEGLLIVEVLWVEHAEEL